MGLEGSIGGGGGGYWTYFGDPFRVAVERVEAGARRHGPDLHGEVCRAADQEVQVVVVVHTEHWTGQGGKGDASPVEHMTCPFSANSGVNPKRRSYGSALTQRKGGLRTPHVLADPPCVHCKGLTCASQKV